MLFQKFSVLRHDIHNESSTLLVGLLKRLEASGVSRLDCIQRGEIHARVIGGNHRVVLYAGRESVVPGSEKESAS